MRRAQLLEKIPALTAVQLDYLARSRYVRYTEVPEGDVVRRDYPEEEVPYLQYLASLLNDGLSPRKASKKARREYPE